jgi:lipopolysaccharide export LptBFGC system permease protein LptF
MKLAACHSGHFKNVLPIIGFLIYGKVNLDEYGEKSNQVENWTWDKYDQIRNQTIININLTLNETNRIPNLNSWDLKDRGVFKIIFRDETNETQSWKGSRTQVEYNLIKMEEDSYEWI